ncbi:hypothetical protein INT47_010930 [Mucor saturninus]|uniref:Uncharacterized protein n=1 Tax=Mucor saturninus TaxID=64648 RepID=A0A8H7RE47_9FUNG|nr:hypothetical protein INT47_010930 [Mucor saturninus]
MGSHWPNEEDVFSSEQEKQGFVAMVKKIMVLKTRARNSSQINFRLETDTDRPKCSLCENSSFERIRYCVALPLILLPLSLASVIQFPLQLVLSFSLTTLSFFGTRSEVQQMLDLAGQHSLQLGCRWSPLKCAILNAPLFSLLQPQIFVLLCTIKMYQLLISLRILVWNSIKKKGLYAAGNIEKRSAGAIKTMALPNSVGVNRNGFSLLLSARLYTTFFRPKIEYGLAISRFTASDMQKLDRLQNKLVGMFIGSQQTTTAKHITCILGMLHRYNCGI